MDLIQAVILGIIQGLTEFLPISSSGHLLLVPAVAGWKDAGAGFTAVIQIGTLLAVLIYFARDLQRTFAGWLRSLTNKELRGTAESKLGWGIVVGTIPIVVAGKAFENQIDGPLRHPLVVASMLIGMALVLWVAERVGRQDRSLEAFSVRDGLVMGLWQAVALIPGSSRSGSTITGGLFLGLERAAAARASFLLSVPAILLSGVYKLIQEREQLLGDGLAPTLVASVAAFISGYAAIAFLMKFLQTRSTLVFVIYRIILGAVILALIARGVLAP